MLQGVGSGAPVHQIRVGERQLRAGLSRKLPEEDDSIRVGDRKRAKQKRLDSTEHYAIRADAERESPNGDRSSLQFQNRACSGGL